MKKNILALAGIALLTCTSAYAQSSYPNRPIRFVVPYAPGGGADIVTRIVSVHLSKLLGQSIIVDNRPGGGTIIGAEIAMRSPPDGYTLFSGITGTMAINPSIYPHLPYDPVKDFTPIAMVAVGSNILVVHPSVPAKNVQELIELAKAQPGKLNYASSGIGGAPHLAGELLKSRAGIDIVHVPYKGSSQASVDLLSGNVQVMITGIGAVMPNIKTGKLRPLAVASASRSKALPDLPAISETLKGFDASTWFGVFAPAGTPPEIVEKLSAGFAQIMARKDVTDELLAQGYEPWVMGSKELGSYVASEGAKWDKVIKAANIKATD